MESIFAATTKASTEATTDSTTAEATTEVDRIDSLISNQTITLEDLNKLTYEYKNLVTFRSVAVRMFKTKNYVIYRPLKKDERIAGMYCFSEVENFFLRKNNESDVCYFGVNNFDDFEDDNLPVKIFRR
jgi:hypothetical protein